MKNDIPVRIPWRDLPAPIHEKTENVLGGPVVEAISQAEGFSPGSADRVRTALGGRVFVKAVSRTWSSSTWDLHRRELNVLRVLPESVRAPRLLDSHDDGEWVALILEDVEGSHPGPGTGTAEALSVLTSLSSLPDMRGTAVQTVLPRVAEDLALKFRAWSRIRHDGASGVLPDRAQEHLDELEDAAEQGALAVAGTHLVHMDCRSDNVLIDHSGQALLIDWPWAGLGARWFDGLVFLLDTRMHGSAVDTDAVLAKHPLFAEVSATDIDGTLAGLTGYCFDTARQPAPPHMPTIRAFQRRAGITGLNWLRTRQAGGPTR